jgi:Holliday junction resolvase RusA-like endonuclease
LTDETPVTLFGDGWADVWFPFPAVVKARPRLGRRRKAFTPEKTKLFEQKVRDWWLQSGAPHFGGVPVYVSVEIHKEGFSVLVVELEQSVRPVGILGDQDNYVKSILDGLHDAVYDNDKQVEWLEVKFIGIPRKPRKATSGR